MTADAVAVVLTYRRPQLATAVVRGLIADEGFAPHRIVVVVNGDGGLVDRDLESSVHMVWLPENSGPAGGYLAGLREALRCSDASWVYVCEDDIGLFHLPHPRVKALIDRIGRLEDETPDDPSVGGVVAYGRQLDARTGLTVPAIVPACGLHPTDVAAWGASLISRCPLEAGVLPDASMFFGYEDFDFWLKMRDAGYRVLVDGEASSSVGDQATTAGRKRVMRAARPLDQEESWRAYYQARNFFVLRRRHGHAGWTRWHLLKSVRRFQLASGEARLALLHGLFDGMTGRTGRVDRYQRASGEHQR